VSPVDLPGTDGGRKFCGPMHTKLLLVLLLLLAAVPGAHAAAKPGPKARPSVQPAGGVLSREGYTRLAQAIVEEYLSGIDEWSRPKVVAAFSLREPEAQPERLASAAAALAAFGRSEGVLLAARAAAVRPDDVVIANTLGAALSRADRNDQALPVLLYARSLAPTSAPVLTNLAAVYADGGDEAQAELLLKMATTAEPKACGAWNALSVLYLNQGKVRDALEAYLHTADCSMLGVRVKLPPSDDPPPRPVPHSSQPTVTRLTHDRTGRPLFRRFPSWTRWEDMAASARSLEAWRAEEARFQLAVDPRAMAQAAVQEFQARAARPEVVFLDPYEAAEIAVGLNVRYYEARLKRISATYREAQKAADDGMKQALDGPQKTFGARVKEAGADGKALRAAHREYCAAAREATARGFATWREAARSDYEQRVEVYTELLGITQPWVESVPNSSMRNLLELMRLGPIWASLMPQLHEYDLRSLLYAMAESVAFGQCDRERGTEPDELQEREGALDKPGFKCPLPANWGVGVPIFESEHTGTSVELTVTDCAAFELEVKQQAATGVPLGVTSSAKYNMRKKDVTLSGGVYAETPKITPGVDTKASWKSSIEVTIHKGEVVDVSWVTGPEVEAGKGAVVKWEDKIQFTLWNRPAPKM